MDIENLIIVARLWLFLRRAFLSQTCYVLQKMIAVKIVDNRLEKVHFADIVKDAKFSCRLFSFAPILSGTE